VVLRLPVCPHGGTHLDGFDFLPLYDDQMIEFVWTFLNSNRQKTHKMRDNHEQPFGTNCKVHAKIAQDRRSDRRSNRIASDKIRQKKRSNALLVNPIENRYKINLPPLP
jgi:hypothetical protein